jgi:hypothetical protein
MLPAPFFGGAAKFAANSLPAQPFSNDEAANQTERRRLQAALDGDFNPSCNSTIQTSDECRLLRWIRRGNPILNLLHSTRVAQLLDERTNRLSVSRLDWTYDQFALSFSMIHLGLKTCLHIGATTASSAGHAV